MGERVRERPRVLVATFGFDDRKVVRAMRLFAYDRLALLGGPRSFRSEGYRRLRDLEAQVGATVETIAVDPWDFAACFRAAVDALGRYPAERFDVRLTVAGGTRVLADAAVLAAFHQGVDCWYVSHETSLRLPVLRGFRVVDALTEAERTVLGLVPRRRRSEEVVGSAVESGLSPTAARGALASLIRKGMLGGDIVRGRAIVAPVPSARRKGSRSRA